MSRTRSVSGARRDPADETWIVPVLLRLELHGVSV